MCVHPARADALKPGHVQAWKIEQPGVKDAESSLYALPVLGECCEAGDRIGGASAQHTQCVINKYHSSQTALYRMWAFTSEAPTAENMKGIRAWCLPEADSYSFEGISDDSGVKALHS